MNFFKVDLGLTLIDIMDIQVYNVSSPVIDMRLCCERQVKVLLTFANHDLTRSRCLSLTPYSSLLFKHSAKHCLKTREDLGDYETMIILVNHGNQDVVGFFDLGKTLEIMPGYVQCFSRLRTLHYHTMLVFLMNYFAY